MGFSIDDLAQLQFDAQVSIDERRNKYGRIGIPSTSGYSIPASEQGKRLLSVTLEDGTIIKADSQRVSPIASAKVRVRRESGIWVIKGADEREVLSGSPSSGTASIPKHSHNIGAPPGLFYPVDPASVNDGMLLPTGSGLQVTVGRVTYPKTDGTIGVYDASGTLDFASAASGLAANQSRWAIAYIDKSDGSANFHSPAVGTAPLNTTTDLEDAIADCLSNISNAYPYHAVRIRAGISTFGTYKMMSGRSMDEKDFIRLGLVPSSGSEGINKDLFVSTADKVVANTTTETSLFGTGEGSLTLPADYLVAGRAIHIAMRGRMGDTGTPTLNIKLKLGSTVIASTGATSLTGISDVEWQLDLMLTCRSAGASGVVVGGGLFDYDDGTEISLSSGSNVTIDTTGALALDVTMTWGTADASNTITAREAMVEILDPNVTNGIGDDITGVTLTNISETVETDTTVTTTKAIDYSTGALKKYTLTGNVVFSITNPPTGGGSIALQLTQDGSGSHTVTWPASVKWAGGTAPTLSTAAGSIDLITLITFDSGTTWLGGSGLAYS